MEKNINAIALGRLGGLATSKKMTKEEKKAHSKKMLLVRWGEKHLTGKATINPEEAHKTI